MGARVRVAALVAGVLGSALLLYTTRSLDAVAAPGQLGPGFWPRLVLIGLSLSCGLKLWADRAVAAPEAKSVAAMRASRLALGVACMLAYTLAAPVVGFPLATAAFIAVFMALAGARAIPGIAATALVSTVVLLYAFVKLVYLPFPKGGGAFERVTLALYRALGIF